MEEIKNFLMLNLLPLCLAFAISVALAPSFIKWLKKLKFGQEIRDEGPKWHESKSGTPTMGGIIFITGIVLGTILTFLFSFIWGNGSFSSIKDSLSILVISLGFGAIGFCDDFIKVVKKRNLGLTSKQKFLLQLLFAIIYIAYEIIDGGMNTELVIPFTSISLTLPLWLYIPLILFVVVGVVNAVNLTDGLDGLATSITIVTSFTFALIAFNIFDKNISSLAIALTGGLLGFLIFNKYPAKVFMGDTGSLFLGAIIALLAIKMNLVLYLIPIGFVYFAETLSVIAQTSYFKYTKKKYGEGRRIFKMSPLHHHFEMCGWKEVKIVNVFTLVTLLLCVISYIGIINTL